MEYKEYGENNDTINPVTSPFFIFKRALLSFITAAIPQAELPSLHSLHISFTTCVSRGFVSKCSVSLYLTYP